MALSQSDPQGLYNYLQTVNLGSKDDNFFRSLGVGFDRGRQDAIDFMGRYQQQNDPVAQAQKIQQFTLQANQPAIQTLTGQQQSLRDQYKTLLDSVLGQGTVAQNYAIRGANTALAQRGITSDSQLGLDTIAQALLPVTAQQQSAIAQVGQGSAQDINALAQQIAALQTGSPEAAITATPQFAGLQALPSQIALTGSQALAAGAQGRYIPIPNVGVYDIQSGSLVGGLSTNNLSSGGFQILNVGTTSPSVSTTPTSTSSNISMINNNPYRGYA